MRKDEDKEAFDLFQASVDIGEGFAANDLPNLAFLRRYMIIPGTFIVIEETATGAMIGWMAICPSWFTRSPSCRAAECTLCLSKFFQVCI